MANVGINIFYSGTVAGAIEAAFYNLPAIAVSAALDDPLDLEAAADYAIEVIRQITDLPAGCVTNLNIPQLSKGKPRGLLVVPQSTHGFEEQYQLAKIQHRTHYSNLYGGHEPDGGRCPGGSVYFGDRGFAPCLRLLADCYLGFLPRCFQRL